jgi:hypothetical protein
MLQARLVNAGAIVNGMAEISRVNANLHGLCAWRADFVIEMNSTRIMRS